MNIAYSILSAASTVEAAVTAEASSGPWKNVFGAVQSTAEAGNDQPAPDLVENLFVGHFFLLFAQKV